MTHRILINVSNINLKVQFNKSNCQKKFSINFQFNNDLMDEINLVLYNIYDPVKIYVQLKV